MTIPFATHCLRTTVTTEQSYIYTTSFPNKGYIFAKIFFLTFGKNLS